MNHPATTSQTVGPYFRIGLSYLDSSALCSEATPGQHITVSGQIFDADGVPVPDAQLELWQADDQGRFAGYDPSESGIVSDGFTGFARIPVDDRGTFKFHTVYPGSVAAQDSKSQAPHVVLMLSMRGILKHLYTRIYFAGDPLNGDDPVLSAVPSERRKTLFAELMQGSSNEYLWNVRLQGADETVFFQY